MNTQIHTTPPPSDTSQGIENDSIGREVSSRIKGKLVWSIVILILVGAISITIIDDQDHRKLITSAKDLSTVVQLIDGVESWSNLNTNHEQLSSTIDTVITSSEAILELYSEDPSEYGTNTNSIALDSKIEKQLRILKALKTAIKHSPDDITATHRKVGITLKELSRDIALLVEEKARTAEQEHTNSMIFTWCIIGVYMLVIPVVLLLYRRFTTYLANIIYEREQALKQVSEQRLMLEELTQAIPNITYRCTTEISAPHTRTFSFFSNNSFEILGLTAEELRHNPTLFAERLDTIDIKEVYPIFKNAVDNLTPFTIVYRYNHPDGKILWLEETAVPRKASENLILWNGVIADVTSRLFEKIVSERASIIAQNSDSVLIEWERITDNDDDELSNSNIQYRLVYASPNVEYIIGVPFDEVSEVERLLECHPDDELSILQPALSNALENREKRCVVEYRIIRRDSSVVWVEDRMFFTYNDEGRVTLRQSVVTDITQRKNHERLLAETNERLYESQLISGVGSWELNLATDELRWSGVVFDMFRMNDIERLSSFTDFLSAHSLHKTSYLRQILIGVYRAMIKGTTYTIEMMFRDTERDDVYVILRMKTITLSDGARVLRGTVQNITEQRRAEEELRRFKEVIENSSSIWVRYEYDVDRRSWLAQHISKNCIKLGYEPDELATLINNGGTLIHPDDRERIDKQVQEYSLKGAYTYTLEYRAVTKNGESHWVQQEFVFTPMLDKGGQFIIDCIITDISAQKQAELSARRAQFIVEQSKSVLYYYTIRNEKPYLEYVSNNIRQFGYEIDNLRAFMDEGVSLIHADDATVMQEKLANAYSEKLQSIQGEYRLRKSDGTYAWVEDNTIIVWDDKGMCVGIQSILTDISERKVQEVRLNQARLIIENSNSVLARWECNDNESNENTLTSKLVYVSPNIERWGYNHESFLQHPLHIVHPADRDYVDSIQQQNFKSDCNSFSFEYRLLLPANTDNLTPDFIWVEEHIYIERDTNGKYVAHNSITTDIEERKQNELRSNRMNMIVENNDSVLMEWENTHSNDATVQRVLTYVSHNCTRLLGYKPEELIGSGQGVVEIHPDDSIRTIPILQEALSNKQRRVVIEYRVRLSNGDWTWVEERLFVTYDSAGRDIRWQNVVTNIHERVMAEQAAAIAKERLEEKARELEVSNVQLESARKQAEAANSAKSAFLSSMSHELRTPLNAIIGFTQVLRKESNLRNDQRKYVDVMYSSGNHLLNMINDILDISKIEAGHMEIVEQEVYLLPLVEEIRAMFAMRCSEKNIDFRAYCSDDIPYALMTDSVRLRQIIINLLSNAVKFTQRGEIKFDVKVNKLSASYNGQQRIESVFSITDTGRGIPQEQIDTIFHPFRQVSGMYSEGTGLGLAITRKLVTIMGGTIHVQSEVGVGSTFVVKIPMVASNATPVHSVPQQRQIMRLQNPDVRLLVVDDIESNLLVARGMLERYGFQVETIQSGSDAIDYLLQSAESNTLPSVILLDILMPEMDGYEVLNVIRSHTALDDIPVIAVTANGFEEAREKAISAGFNDYVRKPYTEESILSAIEKLEVVEFAYSNESSELNTETAVGTTILDVSDAIKELPEKMRNELFRLLEIQDFDAICELIGDIEQYSERQRTALAALLNACRDSNYRFIVELSGVLEG
jgi:PAS domain S-box-containing protein